MKRSEWYFALIISLIALVVVHADPPGKSAAYYSPVTFQARDPWRGLETYALMTYETYLGRRPFSQQYLVPLSNLSSSSQRRSSRGGILRGAVRIDPPQVDLLMRGLHPEFGSGQQDQDQYQLRTPRLNDVMVYTGRDGQVFTVGANEIFRQGLVLRAGATVSQYRDYLTQQDSMMFQGVVNLCEGFNPTLGGRLCYGVQGVVDRIDMNPQPTVLFNFSLGVD